MFMSCHDDLQQSRVNIPAPSLRTLQRAISASSFTMGAELQVCLCAFWVIRMCLGSYVSVSMLDQGIGGSSKSPSHVMVVGKGRRL